MNEALGTARRTPVRTDLSLEAVSFSYRRWGPPTVAQCSLELREGRTLLLGPNGAGKSTLLSLIAGAKRPRTGRVSLGSVRSTSREYRREVAWMPQDVLAVSRCTVREQVALYGWLKGLAKSTAWENSAIAVRRVGLGSSMDRKSAHLSGGQRARLGLAQALVHDASVILLDEPTAALDPAQKVAFREVLASMPPELVIVVSTHDMGDIGDSYDRVIGLDSGTLQFDLSVQEFLRAGRDGSAIDAPSAYAAWFGGEA